MTFPVVGEQDPPQVRVAVENDAEKVECLPLMPVGGFPDRLDGAAWGLSAVTSVLSTILWSRLVE